MARADRFSRQYTRRNSLEKIASANVENFSAAYSDKEFSYLVDAMLPIEEDSTELCFREADRIKNQIESNLDHSYSVNFEYQGSVTSNTHIRVHSDVDLLVLNGRFITVDVGVVPNPSYSGNPLQELLEMRNSVVAILRDKYPMVSIDANPGKAIALSGGSLQRKIDVVIGNWWNTELWNKYRVKMARGIRIVDTKKPELIRNKPFLHNYNINVKDEKTGGLRKVIRLLKTLKYDAEEKVEISSYDIAALAWNMADEKLTVRPDSYFQLAENACSELQRFKDGNYLRESMNVPNGTRKVFGDDGATIKGLNSLHKELDDLLGRINIEKMMMLLERAGRLKKASHLPTWNESLPVSVIEHSF